MAIATDKDEPAFVAALMGEDELGVVVRAHIYIEARLFELLHRFVTDRKHLERMDLDYAQCVHLAIALGLKSQHAPPLLALGSLRDAFAHRPDTKLTKDRVDNLYKALSSDDKNLVHEAYTRTNSQMLKTVGPNFRALSPKDQFILIAVTLRSMLSAAVISVSRRHDAA